MKVKISGEIKVNTYNLLADAIEDGIGYGYDKAHEHTDTPDKETIREHIYTEIMNQITEYFVFEENN